MTEPVEGMCGRASWSALIYRWWPSPAAVLMEALNERAVVLVGEGDLGSLKANLRTFIRRTVAALHDSLAPLVATLMAEAQRDEQFAPVFRQQFLARRRAALRALFEQAVDSGEITPTTHIDLLVEIAFGTVWYRVLSKHAPLNRRFADDLSDALQALASANSRTPDARNPSGTSVVARFGQPPPASPDAELI